MQLSALEILKMLQEQEYERVKVFCGFFRGTDFNPIVSVGIADTSGLVEEEDVCVVVPGIWVPNRLVSGVWVD